ncbi:hypothetical protein KDW55_03965 [Burkholderia sp. AU19243]|uniref:hypothetical protein n=1 Tax=Burkholderia sp. AU19243 TaxID=2824810 RepID=UPI001BA17162|nr:hypothetical protein [Burkholderia sp. AU19243]MBR8144455.1 hypothetical protein [Burkholderia vietnamiensis]MBR8362475.1 hypothetical protein [Burkholderia sp. AU19243]
MMLINVCVRYVVRLQTPNFYIMLLLGAQMVLIAAWVRTAWICAPNLKHRLWMYLVRIWLVIWLLALVQQALRHG